LHAAGGPAFGFLIGETPHFVRNDKKIPLPLQQLHQPHDGVGKARAAAQNGRFFSPNEAPESGNKIKVLVTAYKREGMLAAERGDPKIIGGDGLAFPFQFEADR
jgi:hypothetical protein